MRSLALNSLNMRLRANLLHARARLVTSPPNLRAVSIANPNENQPAIDLNSKGHRLWAYRTRRLRRLEGVLQIVRVKRGYFEIVAHFRDFTVDSSRQCVPDVLH